MHKGFNFITIIYLIKGIEAAQPSYNHNHWARTYGPINKIRGELSLNDKPRVLKLILLKKNEDVLLLYSESRTRKQQSPNYQSKVFPKL